MRWKARITEIRYVCCIVKRSHKIFDETETCVFYNLFRFYIHTIRTLNNQTLLITNCSLYVWSSKSSNFLLIICMIRRSFCNEKIFMKRNLHIHDCKLIACNGQFSGWFVMFFWTVMIHMSTTIVSYDYMDCVVKLNFYRKNLRSFHAFRFCLNDDEE